MPTIVLDEADVYHTGKLKNVTYRILGELVDPFKYFKVSKQLPKPKQLVYVAATLNKFGELRKIGSFCDCRAVVAPKAKLFIFFLLCRAEYALKYPAVTLAEKVYCCSPSGWNGLPFCQICRAFGAKFTINDTIYQRA